MIYHGLESVKNHLKTWQPLGPLLKVKLLVGYRSVKECTGGTRQVTGKIPRSTLRGVQGCPAKLRCAKTTNPSWWMSKFVMSNFDGFNPSFSKYWDHKNKASYLVGGFNPPETYLSKWESSPKRGKKNIYLKPPPRKSFLAAIDPFLGIRTSRITSNHSPRDPMYTDSVI